MSGSATRWSRDAWVVQHGGPGMSRWCTLEVVLRQVYTLLPVLPGTVPWVHHCLSSCTPLVEYTPLVMHDGEEPACQRPARLNAGELVFLVNPAQSCHPSSRKTKREDREE